MKVDYVTSYKDLLIPNRKKVWEAWENALKSPWEGLDWHVPDQELERRGGKDYIEKVEKDADEALYHAKRAIDFASNGMLYPAYDEALIAGDLEFDYGDAPTYGPLYDSLAEAKDMAEAALNAPDLESLQDTLEEDPEGFLEWLDNHGFDELPVFSEKTPDLPQGGSGFMLISWDDDCALYAEFDYDGSVKSFYTMDI